MTSKKRADFARLLAIDAILIKTSVPGTEAIILNLEHRLLQYISNVWTTEAEASVRAGLAAFKSGKNKQPVLAAMAAPFKHLATKLKPAIEAVTRDAYMEGKRQMLMRAHGLIPPLNPNKPQLTLVRKAPRFTIEPDFTLQDERAIDNLIDGQMNWISDFYDEDISGAVDNLVTEAMLQTGLGREEAGKLLQQQLEGMLGVAGVSLPEGWAGRAGNYFEMIAANAASNARTRGALGQMAEIGVTRYAVACAGDERTCDRCLHMDGRTFEVSHAMGIIDQINDADTPDQVKELHPWASKLSDMEGKESSFPFPPYHGRCRCTVDITEDSELTFEA